MEPREEVPSQVSSAVVAQSPPQNQISDVEAKPSSQTQNQTQPQPQFAPRIQPNNSDAKQNIHTTSLQLPATNPASSENRQQQVLPKSEPAPKAYGSGVGHGGGNEGPVGPDTTQKRPHDDNSDDHEDKKRHANDTSLTTPVSAPSSVSLHSVPAPYHAPSHLAQPPATDSAMSVAPSLVPDSNYQASTMSSASEATPTRPIPASYRPPDSKAPSEIKAPKLREYGADIDIDSLAADVSLHCGWCRPKYVLNDSPAKPRITYFYDDDIGNYHAGLGHPLKPHRVRMTHNLIVNYGLATHMYLACAIREVAASDHHLTRFHSDDYVEFLRSTNGGSDRSHNLIAPRFNLGGECPLFEGAYEYSQICTAGSLEAARTLNSREADIAINWSGGNHHAHHSEANGFCYFNDSVLAVIELLNVHQRVMYVNLGFHHCDGIEQAFYATNRVMTVSFHKFGGFFPGTGAPNDIGTGSGRGYSINCPLEEGTSDADFNYCFYPVMEATIKSFKPDCIVVGCGASSLAGECKEQGVHLMQTCICILPLFGGLVSDLSYKFRPGDRLGCYNISLSAYCKAVKFIFSVGKPLLLLGGGGYTVKNTARCWTALTAMIVGEEIDQALPFNDFYEYFGPDYSLDVVPSNADSANTMELMTRTVH
eukprot:UC4_evm1s811